VKHVDRWTGFELERPIAWDALVAGGVVIVREDASGLATALLWPIRLPQPRAAADIARDFAAWARLEAWLAPGGTAERVAGRLRGQRGGRAVEGAFTVVTGEGGGLIAGYQAPRERLNELAPMLAQIVESFHAVEPLPRVAYREPTENAFTAQVPQGWQAQGGVTRQNAYGAAFAVFQAQSDAAGTMRVSIPAIYHSFLEGYAMLPTPGISMLPYMPARVWAERWVPGWLAARVPGLRVEHVVDRPDLLPLLAAETSKVMPPESMELSAADLYIAYADRDVAFRERLTMTCQRPRMGGGLWSAFISGVVRAPADRWAAWEPVLSGVAGSFQQDARWEAAELARSAQISMQMAMDSIRRTREISRTLSETSDIITGGYWERQQVHDRVMHDWSNAFRGREDVVDPSGTVYNVPAHFEQYWRDNQGNILGGGWGVQPDPTWTRLEPRR
jgi:hypothetical protein